MFDRKDGAGASEPVWYWMTSRWPCSVARARSSRKNRRRRHEAPLAEHRLDEDRCDALRETRVEHLISAAQSARNVPTVQCVRERRMVTSGAKGPHSAVGRDFAGHGQREQRAAVITCRNATTPGRPVAARAILIAFRSPLRQCSAAASSSVAIAGHKPVEALREFDVSLVRDDLKAGMRETVELIAIAAMTRGWRWPRLSVPMPAAKSISSARRHPTARAFGALHEDRKGRGDTSRNRPLAPLGEPGRSVRDRGGRFHGRYLTGPPSAHLGTAARSQSRRRSRAPRPR